MLVPDVVYLLRDNLHTSHTSSGAASTLTPAYAVVCIDICFGSVPNQKLTLHL